MIVNDSDTAVGSEPIPAPFAYWPKKDVADTIDHTNHVRGAAALFS